MCIRDRKKEPVQVNTPASVSEIKIPETNVLQILVDPDGKIFMSLDKQQDMQAVLAVSYTHLDVYKRQIIMCIVLYSSLRSFLYRNGGFREPAYQSAS